MSNQKNRENRIVAGAEILAETARSVKEFYKQMDNKMPETPAELKAFIHDYLEMHLDLNFESYSDAVVVDVVLDKETIIQSSFKLPERD